MVRVKRSGCVCNSHFLLGKRFIKPAPCFTLFGALSDLVYPSGLFSVTEEQSTRVVTLLLFLLPTEVPSAPYISEVRPFSTTAQIQFEEPESTGGVPVLSYRAHWRVQGRGTWTQSLHETQDGGGGGGTSCFFSV